MEGTREASAAWCSYSGRARSYQFRRDLPEPPVYDVRNPLYRPVLRHGMLPALVIGATPTVINQGDDVLLIGEVTPLVLLRILLSYVVPYSVSAYFTLSWNRIEGTG